MSGHNAHITTEEFKALPVLVGRAAVIRCGIDTENVDTLRWDVADGPVPRGRLGAVRLQRKWKYRKVDLAVICGLPMS
jgi:hypothetical protein